MSGFRQALPSTATAAGTIARRLLVLKGPAFQAPDGSLNAADALALGASIEDARQMLATARAQAFVCDATYMLDELERLYGLPVDLTSADAVRQSRLLAFVRASAAAIPSSIEAAVATLTGTCTVTEFSASDVYATDPSPTSETRRGVFRFVVAVPLAYAENSAWRALISAVVNRMKPAHTTFTIATSATLKYDTAAGYDLTALGA
ncbi:MAG TPA: DUF2313 domain-containing protein [Pirellulaceae bacterium]|nr:DUF2313 domain-containing protein [Pirellulaceae bacterium]